MKHIKIADIIILLLLAFSIIVLFVNVYSNPAENTGVLIRVDDDSWYYSIETDRTVFIPGPLGETEIVIENGKVHVHDSPCINKICISSGEISRVGQWIVCLPNKVFINIEGEIDEASSEVDDVVF